MPQSIVVWIFGADLWGPISRFRRKCSPPLISFILGLSDQLRTQRGPSARGIFLSFVFLLEANVTLQVRILLSRVGFNRHKALDLAKQCNV